MNQPRKSIQKICEDRLLKLNEPPYKTLIGYKEIANGKREKI